MPDPKANILMVDDHRENLLALEAALAGLDENLVLAESGEEALKCLLKQRFAVVLLDVRLKGMDGFETARLMRERDQSKHTPVIFLTAIDKGDDRVAKGYSLGAVDYIFKPAVPEIVRCKVQVFVDLFKLNRQLEEKARQLARSNAELQRSNQELDQFAYIASHDLREPLRSVDNLSKWIAKDLGSDQLPPSTQRHLHQLRQQVQRMEVLLEDLLEYSRAGRDEGELLSLDLSKLSRDLVRLFDRPEQFEVVVEEDMPTVTTAKTPLEQCLRNLIGNAIKHHNREDGQVKVSCRDAGDFVELVVADDGPGIAPEFHERVFNMFQTLRPRDESESSGMGLAIVKKIVENHGGTITLQSSEGNGATFVLMWPKLVRYGDER
jgi:signal transduction histidine kinase